MGSLSPSRRGNGVKAMEQGVAVLAKTREEICESAIQRIRQAREATDALIEQGLIPQPPSGLAVSHR